MAKKSRRQKLPSDKDFERLNAPKPPKPDPVEGQPATEEPKRTEATFVAQYAQVGEDPSSNVSTSVDTNVESGNAPVYNVDGGMAVSLTGDVAGEEASDGADYGHHSEEPSLEERAEQMADAEDDASPEPSGDEAPDGAPNLTANVEDDVELVDDGSIPENPAFEDAASDDASPAPTDELGFEDEPIVEETFVGRGTDIDEDDEEPEEERDQADDEAPRPPEVLILVGSPHTDGKSALFGRKLSEYLRLSGAAVTLYEIAKYPVAACTGCGACSKTGLCCIKGDAWNVLSRHMESCAALVVIAPVYFAGPSGWLKAALDRCQMYWARKYVLKDWIPRKRPAHLVVIGDGGDPFGTEPLETICTSALNCANLRIEPSRIMRMIGNQYDLRNAVTLSGRVMASIGRM